MGRPDRPLTPRPGYWALLGRPGAARLVASAALGRLAQSMGILTIVLLVRETSGSYAVAGAVTAASAIAAGVAAPLLGRVVDRAGQRRVLLGCVAINAPALGLLAVLAHRQASATVLALVGIAYGATLPPLEPCMARAWRALTGGGPALESAFALEAVTREVLIIVGPLIVALLVAVASPDAAVVAVVALRIGGTTAFAIRDGAGRVASPTSPSGRWRGALGGAGLRTFVLVSLAIGVTFGILQIAIPAFAERYGSREQAGLLLACWAFGSLVAGLWYGSRHWQAPPARRYAIAVAAIPLLILPLALARSVPAMAPLMVLAGAPIAPLFATAYTLIDQLAPEGTATEAFALYSGALALGISAGAGAAGTIVSATGPSTTIALAAASAALATPLVAARRRTLRSTPLGEPPVPALAA